MIRSLFAGVSGMKSHQIRMDVIGNNIANVNTVGFKKGRVNFEDTLYQTIKNSSKNTNPAQAGLGTAIAGITSDMNSGGLQSTGRALDLAINGDGFFRFSDPKKDFDDVSNKLYGREGTLYISNDGSVVNSNGLNLVAYQWNVAATQGTLDLTSCTVGPGGGSIELRKIKPDGSYGPLVTVNLTEGMDIDDIVEQINRQTSNSGVEATKTTDDKLKLSAELNSLNNFEIKNINCDLNLPATHTATNQMNETINLSSVNAATEITVSVTDANSTTHNFTISATDLQSLNGNNITQEDIVNIFKNASGTSGYLQDYMVVENINGKLSFTTKASGGNANIQFILTDGSGGADTTAIDNAFGLDFAGAGGTVNGTAGSSNANSDLGLATGKFQLTNYGQRPLRISQDCLPVGSIDFQNDGTVSGFDTNGKQITWTDMYNNQYDATMIKLYTFPNQDGLERVDKNIFTLSPSSGQEQEGVAGTTGYGTIESGYLEMSNVDLTDEFSTMITTQRGYQASARMITVSDTMLEELLNLKR